MGHGPFHQTGDEGNIFFWDIRKHSIIFRRLESSPIQNLPNILALGITPILLQGHWLCVTHKLLDWFRHHHLEAASCNTQSRQQKCSDKVVLHALYKGWLTYGMCAQKWHEERFPWHTTFTAVPIYFLPLCPTSVSILWKTCIYRYSYTDYIWITITTNVSETLLHRSGEVQSVDWIFIIGVPAWWRLGECVTLGIPRGGLY